MKKLVIEREAVKNNITVVKDRAGSACIYAVLTGDGFGAGITELAQLLREEGVGRFAVSEPAEAAALRKAGLVEEELLMLRPTTDREELEQLIDLNVVCTIGSADTGMALNGVAEARSTVAEAHIQIDTGMGFGGFLAAEPDKILSAYRNLPNVAISGVYTQIHATKRDGRDAAPQLEEFQQVVEAIRAAGFETGVVHAAGSYALMHYEFARLDAVRAGSALMGRCRRSRGDGLLKVGYGEVGIEETRWLPRGHTVGMHSNSHKYNDIYASVDACLQDFDLLRARILEVTGQAPSILRFPGGSVNGYNRDIYQELISEMLRRGYAYFDWNVSAQDATSQNKSVADIANAVVTAVPRHRYSIVLLHDTSLRETSVKAVDRLIPQLLELGYTFAPLDPSVSPIIFSYK